MIAERSQTGKVEGNMTGQQYRAGIDDENMSHIISLFTDLYSDQMLAVIREYSTNAYDAQVEAGVTRPIEVSTPTALSPFFKVKDFGIGLSGEDIGRIYSRYGTSTKRATNDQNGMLGLGCKSALTYSQQFSVESVKDGTRMVCSISREDDDVPVMTVIAEVPTDEPNGTTVIVPVQRHHFHDFEIKAEEFYGYWKAGTVLLNGEQPKPHKGRVITDGLFVREIEHRSYNRKAARVLMGNVTYPIDPAVVDLGITGMPPNMFLVAEVPIGAVEFTPSREALMYTKRTKQTLQDVANLYKSQLDKAVQRDVENAASVREAVQAALDWAPLMGGMGALRGRFKFKGNPLPTLIEGDWTLTHKNSYKKGESQRAPRGIDITYAGSSLFVKGYDLMKFTAQHKRKLNQYVADKKIEDTVSFTAYVLGKDAPNPDLVDSSRVISWDDVKTVQLPTTPRGRSGRPTGAYDAYVRDTRKTHVQADTLDTKKPLYYCRGLNADESHQFAVVILESYPDATIVPLPENRYDKFKRTFPMAKSYRDGIEAAYKKWEASLTADERMALLLHDFSDWHLLSQVAKFRSKIKDPKLVAALKIAADTDMAVLSGRRSRFQRILHAISTRRMPAGFVDPLKAYPLLEEIGGYYVNRHTDDIALYINAKYAS